MPTVTIILPPRRCFCDRFVVGEPFILGRDCQRCFLWNTHPEYREKHPEPATRAASEPTPAPTRKGLGDLVETALSVVGVTQDRVKAWMGDCGCVERKKRLNDLGDWARRALGLSPIDARNDLDAVIGKT